MSIKQRAFVLYVAIFTTISIGIGIVWATYRLFSDEIHVEFDIEQFNRRNLLLVEDYSHDKIIYAPGHEPTHHNRNESDIIHDLEKARKYDVDVIAETFWYVGVAAASNVLACSVLILLLMHTIWMRSFIARGAYEDVYTSISIDIPKEELNGICNLYMNNKIVSIIWIFAFTLPIYNLVVLLGPVAIPHAVLCTTDPVVAALIFLPINAIAVFLLFYAMINTNRHFVLIHSTFTMYSTVFLCMTLIGLASGQPLCVQTIATQAMFVLSAWIFFWSPKIAGLSSLRDRLAYEKQVLKDYDRLESAFRQKNNPTYTIDSSSDEYDEDITNPVGVNL